MMYGARDQFFARAGFAFDENVGVRRRHFFHETKDGLQRFRRAYDLGETVAAFEFAPERAVLAKEFALAYGVLDRLQQIFVDEGLRDVVIRAFAQRGDGRVHGRISGHHDDEGFAVNVLDAVEQREAVHARHAYVRERDGDIFGGKTFQRLFGVRGLRDAITGLFEQAGKNHAHQVFIFGDENEWRCVHVIRSRLLEARERFSSARRVTSYELLPAGDDISLCDFRFGQLLEVCVVTYEKLRHVVFEEKRVNDFTERPEGRGVVNFIKHARASVRSCE
jgi:hypothetical protein